MGVQAYPHPVRPEFHPLYARRSVKAVTREQLGNKIRFIALRWFERDEAGRIVNIDRTLDLYTSTFRLCDVVWPEYTFLFAPNFNEVVDALAARGLYVFDFWGYVPGSGRAADNMWAEYRPPEDVYRYMQETLGDRFIGFDNGEQDGRYIGGYAGQMCPASGDRKRQYANFQRHFEKLGDDMHNYTTVLASLMCLHHFAKEDNAIMLGAETAQALPSTNMWYAFIRGAGKQYGLLWYGNASVFNRWGFKSYFMSTGGEDSYEKGDPENGASLSLLKRLLYTEYMYNSAMLGYDMGWINDDHRCDCIDPKHCVERDGEYLNPLGIVQQGLRAFAERHGDPGVQYTPVCLYAGFFGGWQPPRHLYTRKIYTAWGNRPYGGGDHLMDRLVNLLYPGYSDCSYFRDERGFLTPTPFGDIADVLLDDAAEALMQTYRLLLLAGEGELTYESFRKVLAFAQAGGHAVLTAEKLDNCPAARIDRQFLLRFGIRSLARAEGCERYAASLTGDAAVAVSDVQGPLILETPVGRGRVSVILASFGLEPTGWAPFGEQEPAVYDADRFNGTEMSLPEPVRLIPAVRQYIEGCLDSLAFLRPTHRALQYAVNVIDDRTFTLLVCNNGYDTVRFGIECRTAGILSVEELKIEDVSPDVPGYYPPERYVPRNFGAAGEGSHALAPCELRIYRVRTDAAAVELLPEMQQACRRAGRYLTIPESAGVKDYILQNPTALDHFEGFKVHGRYFERSDAETLRADAAYARRRGAGVVVDISSLINHYPDFSLLRNIPGRTEEAERRFARILDKAAPFGCKRAVMILQRNAENALSADDAHANLLVTLCYFREIAARRGVELFVQNGRSLSGVTTAEETGFTAGVAGAAGIPLAFSLCHSVASREDTADAICRHAPRALLLSAPYTDSFGQMFDDHLPISVSGHAGLARECVSMRDWDFVCLDGDYECFDRAYADLEALGML